MGLRQWMDRDSVRRVICSQSHRASSFFAYGPSKGFEAWGALSSQSEEGALQNSFVACAAFERLTEFGGTHGAVTAAYGPSKGFEAWGALSSQSEEGALQNSFVTCAAFE